MSDIKGRDLPSPAAAAAPSGALADLHRHLDGSLRAATLAELAARAGVQPPADLRFHPGMGLEEALARFAFTLSLLQEPAAVRRVAAELCEDAAAEGVQTLEIRFAPQLHRGAELEAIVEAALEGIDRRAGLILCGLYGEPPELLERLVQVGSAREGVVGLDLAGGPGPAHAYRLRDYERPFRLAAERGLGTTVHAGEGRAPVEIGEAVTLLGARRIGHGTTLLQDRSVVDLLLEREVTVEACITSNYHTGATSKLLDHPLVRWLELGVKACICTDNTLLSAVDAPEEHRRAASLPGMAPELLQAAIDCGHCGAFGGEARAVKSPARQVGHETRGLGSGAP